MAHLNNPHVPKIGEIIECKEHRLMVVEMLATGPFSQVFKLHNADLNQYYAMKLELRDNQRRMLKLDAYVLTTMNEANIEGFPKILVCGRTNYYDFIIMKLIGQNLGRLRRASPDKMFSLSTAIRIAMLTLDRIEALHHKGFLSRDVKPDNFAIGIDHHDDTVYMFDFGLARRYYDKDGNHYPPRRVAALLGTVLYASLATHDTMDQCRRDDLESWFYMVVEMITGSLPWAGMILPNFQHHTVVADFKRFCHEAGRTAFLKNCPSEFDTIFNIIKTTTYYQTPDYELIRRELEKVGESIDMRRPFDWNISGSDILQRSGVVGDVGETHLVSLKLWERREQTIPATQSITGKDDPEIFVEVEAVRSKVELITPPHEED